MPHGFYQLLGVADDASTADIELAYNKELAALVRRLRSASQQGADTTILQARERALREARAVLCDDARRRRYDAFRKATDGDLPRDAEGLWAAAAGALVDPVAVAALRVVRTLTDLPVGEPFPGVAEPPPPLRMPVLPPMEGPAAASWSDGGADAAGPPSDFAGDTPTLAPTSSAGAPADGPLPTAPGFSAVAQQFLDPLEELLADLSGTDAGEDVQAEPSDPVDRLARDFGYDGRFLEGVRRLRELSVDDLAAKTRISKRYLQAIEANGYDQLPAATFVRGYLKQIVGVLDLGDRDVVGGYMTLFHRQRG